MRRWKEVSMLLLAAPMVVALITVRFLSAAAGEKEFVCLAEGATPGVIHGDTSVSEEELVKLYADKIPTEVFLKENCRKMPPVLFRHKEHVERKIAGCTNCHHKKPREQMVCHNCHPPTPAEKETPKYEKAFHGLCQKCHKAYKKGAAGPPVKCNQCHKKENTAAAGVNCPAPGIKPPEEERE